MAVEVVVCFHECRRCTHCNVGVGASRPSKARRRCSCCGRFVGAVSRCQRCAREGFVALTLFV